MDKIEAGDAEETPGMSGSVHTVASERLADVYQRECVQTCVCVFAGELFQEMAVDYERGTSVERIDEVCERRRHVTSNTASKAIFHLKMPPTAYMSL